MEEARLTIFGQVLIPFSGASSLIFGLKRAVSACFPVFWAWRSQDSLGVVYISVHLTPLFRFYLTPLFRSN
jgi:hypothetical protein